MWMAGAKRFILADLWRNGPVVDMKSGRATGIFWKRMEESFPGEVEGKTTSFPGFTNDPLNAPAFELIKKGKRTYSIKLIALPQTWYDYLERDESERAKAKRAADRAAEKLERERLDREAAETVASAVMPLTDADIATESLVAAESRNGTDIDHDAEFDDIMRDMQLDAPTVYDMEPPLEIAMASQVAMSLLTTVVEIISAGTGAAVDEKVRALQSDLNDIAGKLSARLEDNDRMRRQLRQAGDEIQALRYERDGLRSRLRATEANLTAALKGDAVQAINGEIQRRVESIMRVAPSKKGED
jgi:regulator of replication initiation timing